MLPVLSLLALREAWRPAAPGATPAFCLPTKGAVSFRQSTWYVFSSAGPPLVTGTQRGWVDWHWDMDAQMQRQDQVVHTLSSPAEPPFEETRITYYAKGEEWVIRGGPGGVCTKSTFPPNPQPGEQCLAPNGVTVPTWGRNGTWGPVTTVMYEVIDTFDGNGTATTANGGTTLDMLMKYRGGSANASQVRENEFAFEDYVRGARAPPPCSCIVTLYSTPHALAHPSPLQSTAPIPASTFALPAGCPK